MISCISIITAALTCAPCSTVEQTMALFWKSWQEVPCARSCWFAVSYTVRVPVTGTCTVWISGSGVCKEERPNAAHTHRLQVAVEDRGKDGGDRAVNYIHGEWRPLGLLSHFRVVVKKSAGFRQSCRMAGRCRDLRKLRLRLLYDINLLTHSLYKAGPARKY